MNLESILCIFQRIKKHKKKNLFPVDESLNNSFTNPALKSLHFLIIQTDEKEHAFLWIMSRKTKNNILTNHTRTLIRSLKKERLTMKLIGFTIRRISRSTSLQSKNRQEHNHCKTWVQPLVRHCRSKKPHFITFFRL